MEIVSDAIWPSLYCVRPTGLRYSLGAEHVAPYFDFAARTLIDGTAAAVYHSVLAAINERIEAWIEKTREKYTPFKDFERRLIIRHKYSRYWMVDYTGYRFLEGMGSQLFPGVMPTVSSWASGLISYAAAMQWFPQLAAASGETLIGQVSPSMSYYPYVKSKARTAAVAAVVDLASYNWTYIPESAIYSTKHNQGALSAKLKAECPELWAYATANWTKGDIGRFAPVGDKVLRKKEIATMIYLLSAADTRIDYKRPPMVGTFRRIRTSQSAIMNVTLQGSPPEAPAVTIPKGSESTTISEDPIAYSDIGAVACSRASTEDLSARRSASAGVYIDYSLLHNLFEGNPIFTATITAFRRQGGDAGYLEGYVEEIGRWWPLFTDKGEVNLTYHANVAREIECAYTTGEDRDEYDPFNVAHAGTVDTIGVASLRSSGGEPSYESYMGKVYVTPNFDNSGEAKSLKTRVFLSQSGQTTSSNRKSNLHLGYAELVASAKSEWTSYTGITEIGSEGSVPVASNPQVLDEMVDAVKGAWSLRSLYDLLNSGQWGVAKITVASDWGGAFYRCAVENEGTVSEFDVYPGAMVQVGSASVMEEAEPPVERRFPIIPSASVHVDMQVIDRINFAFPNLRRIV